MLSRTTLSRELTEPKCPSTGLERAACLLTATASSPQSHSAATLRLDREKSLFEERVSWRASVRLPEFPSALSYAEVVRVGGDSPHHNPLQAYDTNLCNNI